ncbi:MAG: SDR family oxidoreductase, partial [Thermoanaerobaculia bacterium]
MPHASDQDFARSVAVVTGASSGIGRAVAETLLARGAVVAIFARSMEKLASITTAHRDRMIAVAGDIAEAADVDRLFREVESKLGVATILVNNAGMIDPGRIVDVTPERWDRMFAVNVRGAFLATRRALPGMIAKRRGAIVNVSSITGVPGPEKFPGFAS